MKGILFSLLAFGMSVSAWASCEYASSPGSLSSARTGRPKMKNLSSAFLLVAALVTPISARAGNVLSSTEMYYSLQNLNNPSYSFWQGFVAGASFSEGMNGLVCGRYTVGQAIQTVLNYMAENPKFWTARPEDIVYFAITQAYPCKVH